MIGVENMTGEVELLAAMVGFFKSLGVTAKDVRIKVNSRKVLNAVVRNAGVADEDFPKVRERFSHDFFQFLSRFQLLNFSITFYFAH